MLSEAQHRQKIFDELDFPEDCEEDCVYLRITPDAKNTGDSPTEYSCDGSCNVCPVIN